MIQNVGLNQAYVNKINGVTKNTSNSTITGNATLYQPFVSSPISSQMPISTVSTALVGADYQKYLALTNFLKNVKPSLNSLNTPPNKQLEILLKNGKLLAKSSHDNSTTLDNLYNIISTDRVYNLDKLALVTSTLDLLVNPRFVTQKFGDIPLNVQQEILRRLPSNDDIQKNPASMNVESSGTCAAASVEVNMASQYPAEFARWVSELSSAKKSVSLNVKLTSLSKNPFDAFYILDMFGIKKSSSDLMKTNINVELDGYAYARAYTQSKHWNYGERNVADVLIQSAIMNLGSQGGYNALTDQRKVESEDLAPQGLIEVEKTFVESLIKNKEITSLSYMQIDNSNRLVGYNCSFDKMLNHITQTIDTGDNVILGYVFTNENSGLTSSPLYSPKKDGDPNYILGGHEITVVDYYKDENGKIVFVCIDTDDSSPELVQYHQDWLLPKIHHAGYPASIVEKDEKEIMQKALEYASSVA